MTPPPQHPSEASKALVERLAEYFAKHCCQGMSRKPCQDCFMRAQITAPFIESLLAAERERCAEVVNKCYEKRHTMFKDDMLALIIRTIRALPPGPDVLERVKMETRLDELQIVDEAIGIGHDWEVFVHERRALLQPKEGE